MFSRLALAIVVSWMGTPARAAQPHHRTIICVNVASGTKWPVHIDFDHAAVDGFSAQIDTAEISWHDARDSGNYTLERKSGELTAVFASSTGGYFMHHRCTPDGSK